MAFQLEFPGGQRGSFLIDRPELIIGRGAACALRVEGDAAEQHARVTVDGTGHVFIQDLDTHTGTLRNGNYVYGVQRLDEGDQLQIGGVTLVFRAAAPVASVTATPTAAAPKTGPMAAVAAAAPMAAAPTAAAPKTAPMAAAPAAAPMAAAPTATSVAAAPAAPAPAPPAGPQRAGAADRTQVAAELPPEVRAALAARAQEEAARAAARSTPSAGAGVASAARSAASAPAAARPAANAPSANTPSPNAPSPSAPSAARTPAPAARPASPPPPAPGASASGVVVGTPDPEPANFRTVQMEAVDLAKLGIEAPTPSPSARVAPPPSSASAPEASPSASAPPADAPPTKRTILGMPTPVLPGAFSAAVATSAAGASPSPTSAAASSPASSAPAASSPAAASSLGSTAAPVAPAASIPFAPASPGVVKPSQTLKTEPMQAVPPPAATPAPPPALSLGTQPTMMAQAPSPAAYAAPPNVPTAIPPKTQAVPRPIAYPEPTVPVQPLGKPPQPYAPPATKGAFGSFSRALAFMGQIFTLASRHKALLKPLLWDVLLTTPIMAAFTVLQFFVHSEGAFYATIGAEAFLLYFVDYACNAITASLVYDFSTSGQASLDTALPRVKKALPGVLTFAAVSALLDVATTYARERNDFASRIVLRILRAIWTTATYVIMPALVIEGVSFGAAFGRSKKLMDHDPTGVGAGVVAMSLSSYIVAAICFPLAYFTMRLLAHVHPAIGALGGMLIVNLYWAVSGWMKIAYATCFYMWARECERTGSADHALAPLPLRAALDAA